MRKYHRDLIDWLETTYQVCVNLEQTRTHPRLVFNYGGASYSYPVAGTPSDAFRGQANCKSDLRRILGAPPPLPSKPKRTLTELTQMAEVSAFRNPPRVLQATPLTVPSAQSKTYLGSVAQYEKRTRFTLPREVSEFIGKSGLRIRYLGQNSYEIEKVSDSNATHQFKTGRSGTMAIDIYYKNKQFFGASPSDYVIAGNQVLVKTTENLSVRYRAKSRKRPTEAVRQEMWPKEKVIVTDASSQTFAPPPIEDRMRAALTEIRALEQQTTYRLRRIGDDKRWAWVAPTIE